jgi:hypothetical protein
VQRADREADATGILKIRGRARYAGAHMPEKFKTPESKVNMNTGNQTNFLGGNVVVTSQVMLEFLPVPSRRLVSLPFRTGSS